MKGLWENKRVKVLAVMQARYHQKASLIQDYCVYFACVFACASVCVCLCTYSTSIASDLRQACTIWISVTFVPYTRSPPPNMLSLFFTVVY